MGGRAALRKTVVCAVAMTVLWAGGASAASASPSRASVTKYGKSTVVRAFRANGIGLYDTGFGAVQPVTVFASTKPHQGWSLAVYVYVTPKDAAQSYQGNIDAWRGAGMAAGLKKNIVVTVVPKNRITIANKAKPWPMPDLVTKTLASLPA